MVVALAKPVAKMAGAPASLAQSPGILVVDDEEPIRRLLQLVLQRQGFEVWLAADGSQALKLYDRFRTQIDLVLLDVRMPGLNGPQTLAALRQLNPEVPCCFLTGQAWEYSERQLRGQGAVQVFAKPFALEELATSLWLLATQTGNQEAELDGDADSLVRESNHGRHAVQ